jgi:proteasome lid subunit RPN8/RPN11
MADLATDGAQLTWEAPQCPFTIEYSARVLDDIRLAVVDAFFSLPRGGAEIGGILLGRHEPGRVAITSYQAIECEHATGPSFTLSLNDQAKLRDQLAAVRGQVVGWYHSHTRSEIFLSEADLEIQKRFFSQPWQIAIVMKPHTFQPMRLGVFFCERDGTIHASAAYQEMLLEALPMRQVPSGEPPFQPSTTSPYRRELDERGPAGPIIDVALPKEEPAPMMPPGRPVLVRAPEPPPVVVAAAAEAPAPAPVPPAPDPERETTPLAPPSFLTVQPETSRRWQAFLAIVLGLAFGVAGYQTHEAWLPGLKTKVTSALPASGPPAFDLNTLDTDGQLQIRWDRSSAPARTGIAAILEITDGAQQSPQSIPIDPQHLQAGVFTYGRQADKVEVKLTIRMPDGRDVREATTFLGALPPRLPPPEDPEIRRQRDELAAQAEKLKSDLAAQEKRTKKLERSLSDVQKSIRQEQLKRLENQAPAK